MDLNQSILGSIKQMLGIVPTAMPFDDEIILHINSTFTPLAQLQVCDEGFNITGYTETWEDCISDPSLADMAKVYIYLRVRLIFDPPASSIVSDAMNSRLAELEWRLNIQAERKAQLAAESEEATT